MPGSEEGGAAEGGGASRRGLKRLAGVRLGLFTVAIFICGLVLAGEISAWLLNVEETLSQGTTWRDFLQFYTGASLVKREDGARLYDLEWQRQVEQDLLFRSPEVTSEFGRRYGDMLPFLSPPFVALLMSPLAALDLPQAYVFWGVLNGLVVLGCVVLLCVAARGWPLEERALFALGSFSVFPVFWAQLHGQVSAWLLLAGVLAWLAFSRGYAYRGGLSLALLAIKPQYGILVLPYLLVRGQWRAAAGFVSGLGLLALVPLLTVGPRDVLAYPRLLAQVPAMDRTFGMFPLNMANWRYFVSLLGLSGGLGWALLVLLSILTLVVAVVAWRSPSSPTALYLSSAPFAIFLLATLLISPHTYTQDLVLLILVAFLIWHEARREPLGRKGRWAWATGLALGYVAMLVLGIEAGAVLVPLETVALVALALRYDGSAGTRRVAPARLPTCVM